MASVTNIWVFTEWRENRLREVSLGLLGEGKRITDSSSGKLYALVLGKKPKEEIRRLFSYGADEVIALNLPSGSIYNFLPSTKILIKLIDELKPGLILFPANHLFNELAGKLSVELEAGLVTNARRLDIEAGEINIIKNTHRDQIENRIRIHSTIQLVTLRPKELQSSKQDPRDQEKLIQTEIDWDGKEIAFEVISHTRGDPKTIDLEYAEVIVAGGRGVGSQEAFQLLHKLADVLGASVGGSREAVDRGWLRFCHQIGQSGKKVSPRCIITLGISGAIQFFMGAEDAEYVVAVNKDKGAPIFSHADLKIVGDLHGIVRALIKYIKEFQISKVEMSQR